MEQEEGRRTPPTSRPRQRAGVIERVLPGEVILYRGDRDRLFLLCRVAAMIWELCNGQWSHTEIAAQLARRFDAPLELVRADVENTLAQFKEDGLVIDAPA